MKTLKSTLLLLALGATTFLTSCKKDDKEVDPRDAYVGKYEMEGKCGSNRTREMDLEIEKDPKSATGLIVTFDFYSVFGIDEVDAQIKNGKLVLDEADGEIEDPESGEVISVTLEAEGSLSGKKLSLDVVADDGSGCEFEGDKN